MQRFCVALAMPQPLGARLDRARQLLQPNRRHMSAHLTVVPPVTLTAQQAQEAAVVVRQVAQGCEPIPVALRGAESFAPRSATVYLRVDSDWRALQELAQKLDQEPLPSRLRPLHPHVTIVSRASSTLIDAAVWAFADFAADVVIDTLTLFVLTDDGWWPFSEGRMGGSRP